MNMFREIHLVYEGFGAINYVFPITKTYKGKSNLFCQGGNDICSVSDERIEILPNWFNIEITLNLKDF